MVLSRIRAPPEVFPLIAIVSFAGALIVGASIRAVFKYPDVSWDHKHNPHPWLHVKPKEQVKLYSSYDYHKLDTAAVPKV